MPTSRKITHMEVRMYRMGTGDCFVLKFFADKTETFKMMIDCGTWQGKPAYLKPFILDLMSYVNNHVDVLVVTHEHKDHVHVFDACKELFVGKDSKFTVDRIWMAWTEKDSDSKVAKWKTEFGEKKKALSLVSNKFTEIFRDQNYVDKIKAEFNGISTIRYKHLFADGLNHFSELHFGAAGRYVGPLEGMNIVKKEIANDNIEYFSPGKIIENIPGAEDVRFYVLGPPLTYAAAKVEKGGKGQTYDHNTELAKSNAFAAAMINYGQSKTPTDLLPFDQSFVESANVVSYDRHEWRKIDYDWLNSGAWLALRMNSITNNLSLALAIEVGDNGRVLLFPGDAEFGSWDSWHKINWGKTGKDKTKHLTEDLLNRTVFYKVAHHLSHNGTAKEKGLDMMIDKDLMVMATLDYDVISDGWKSTMPNRAILKDLIEKTQGRVVIMNEQNLYMDFKNKELLSVKLKEARSKMSKNDHDAFKKSFKNDNPHYYQLTVNV